MGSSPDFETLYLKTLHRWSFHFLVRHWQNDSCYPIRNLVAYQKRSIFCCFSKCLSAIGWTDFCSKHSVELISSQHKMRKSICTLVLTFSTWTWYLNFPILKYLAWNSKIVVYLKCEFLRLKKNQFQSRKKILSSTKKIA